MILLHAACLADGLYLWGESPGEAAAASPRRRPRAVPPLPTSASRPVEAVAAVVPSLGPPGPAESLVAWLPTSAGHPLPSSPLIAPDAEPEPARTTDLSPWMVTAVPL